ncbi:MAG TPA: hypothetical protein VFV52_10145 [Bacilli bacterium]|nr:hypothetical protein [Bacilli bacterium]
MFFFTSCVMVLVLCLTSSILPSYAADSSKEQLKKVDELSGEPSQEIPKVFDSEAKKAEWNPTKVPFDFSSQLKGDTIETKVKVKGALSDKQHLTLTILEPKGKDVLFTGEIKEHSSEMLVENLKPDYEYDFNLRLITQTETATGVQEIVESYVGDLLIDTKEKEDKKPHAPKVMFATLHKDVYTRNQVEVEKDKEVGQQGIVGPVYSLIPAEDGGTSNCSTGPGLRCEVESNNTFSAADRTYDDYEIYGRISSEADEDYFKVAFGKSGKANFFLGRVPVGVDYDLYLYDQNYNFIAKSINGSNDNELISQFQVYSGREYFIKVIGYGYDATNYYQLRVKNYPADSGSILYEKELNEDFATATPMYDDYDMYGRVAREYDDDYYKVTFAKSGQANFWLGELPSGKSYDLYVYDQYGTMVTASAHYGDVDELCSYNVMAGQPYYVYIRGEARMTYDPTQYYHFRVKNYPQDLNEPNNSMSDPTVLKFSTTTSLQTVYANIHEASDWDYYQFTVPLRSSFTANLSSIPSGTNYNLKLMYGTGTTIYTSSNAGTVAENIEWELNPGTYYVAVWSESGYSDQNYRLQLTLNTLPVILVPGIGGSPLFANGSRTWIGFWDTALNEPVKDNLTLQPAIPGSADVVSAASGVTITTDTSNYGINGVTSVGSQEFWFQDSAAVYRDMITDLKADGYVVGKTLFGFPYDWRLDNRAQNSLFTNKINEALANSGAKRVQIVAHSMGGLLVKDYLLTNTSQQSIVEKFITIGTPFLGAARASKAIAFGGYNFGIPWMYDSTGEALAQNSPAVYQLAPSAEYDRQMYAVFGRGTYSRISVSGELTNQTYSALTDQYSNAALVNLANTRHTQWDLSYPNVTQYHIIGDNNPTMVSFNYNDAYGYMEFVNSRGDGTVPLISADNPGSPSAKKYYADVSSHAGMLKDLSVRNKVRNLLKGYATTSVSGIRTTPNSDTLGYSTAYSLTGDTSTFSAMSLEVVSPEGSKETVSFTKDGQIDRVNSSGRLQLEMTKLEQDKFNFQLFLDKEHDAVIFVHVPQMAELQVDSYDTDETGAHNRKKHGKYHGQQALTLIMKQVDGNVQVVSE